MKSYTDLEQSKKLAEILPLESVDACWTNHLFNAFLSSWRIESTPPQEYKNLLDGFAIRGYLIEPAWSLSALLKLMPKHIKQNDGRTYKFHFFNDVGFVIQRWGCSYCAEDFHNRAEYLSDPHLKYPTNVYSDKYEDPIDAVFEMVVWLKENGKI